MDPGLERWMLTEKDEEDAAADAAFLAVMTALPRVEAGPGFVARVDARLERARVRRRAVVFVGRAAAAVLIAAASLAAAYVLLPVVARAGVQAVVLLASGIVAFVSTLEGGMTWWSLTARVVDALGESLATPRTTALFIGIECVAAAALYMLHRLLGTEGFQGDSEEARA